MNLFEEKLHSKQHNMADLKAHGLMKSGGFKPLKVTLGSSPQCNNNNVQSVTQSDLDNFTSPSC